jgi:hypothetical protein
MGLRYFHKFFKYYILNAFKLGYNYVRKPMKKSRKFKRLGFYKKRRYIKRVRRKKLYEIYSLNYIIKSYRKFYIFFSFLDKFFRIMPTYPNNLFNKVIYKNLFRVFRMYFVFRPY